MQTKDLTVHCSTYRKHSPRGTHWRPDTSEPKKRAHAVHRYLVSYSASSLTFFSCKGFNCFLLEAREAFLFGVLASASVKLGEPFSCKPSFNLSNICKAVWSKCSLLHCSWLLGRCHQSWKCFLFSVTGMVYVLQLHSCGTENLYKRYLCEGEG